MLCPFKGTPLGDWSPSTSVQGHMIPDSDGEAHERVYHLQSTSISITPCCPPILPVGDNGQGSHHRGI